MAVHIYAYQGASMYLSMYECAYVCMYLCASRPAPRVRRHPRLRGYTCTSVFTYYTPTILNGHMYIPHTHARTKMFIYSTMLTLQEKSPRTHISAPYTNTVQMYIRNTQHRAYVFKEHFRRQVPRTPDRTYSMHVRTHMHVNKHVDIVMLTWPGTQDV
jgi:hypothetical protein